MKSRNRKSAFGLVVALALAIRVNADTPCAPSSIGLPCTTGSMVYDGSGGVWTMGNDTFTYDVFGRLLTSNLQSSNGKGQAYGYDAAGNLTLVTYTQDGVVNGGIPPIDNQTYASSNHLKSATYDDAGDVTAVSGMTFTYDASGMATSTATANVHKLQIYTASDERIGTLDVAAPSANAKIDLRPYVATWRIRGVVPQVLRELRESAPASGAATWSWARDWTWRDSILFAESLPLGANSESWRHYHLDHLGTPRLITDESGSKVSVHHYYPFGEEITPVLGQTEIAKFTGHERDFIGGTITENKQYLDYMHARFEGPLLGRFLSIDPAPADPQFPKSWNRYAYVWNNPVLLIDRTGRVQRCFWVVIGGGQKEQKDKEGTLICTEFITVESTVLASGGSPGGGSGSGSGSGGSGAKGKPFLDQLDCYARAINARGASGPGWYFALVYGNWKQGKYPGTYEVDATPFFNTYSTKSSKWNAITFGNVVVRRQNMTASDMAHEYGHVSQYENVGALFYGYYVWDWVTSGLDYNKQVFESDATRRAASGDFPQECGP